MGLGPHIRHAKVEGATLADVPATALALLGCKIPEDFDGRVLEEMLTDDVELPGRSSESGSSADKDKAVYSAEDEATIEQRLRGLGYL
jgi:arylsulfatase A-like enzyme